MIDGAGLDEHADDEQRGVDARAGTGRASCSTSYEPAPIASGTPARVIRKANSPALAMMNMITAEEITDFCRIA